MNAFPDVALAFVRDGVDLSLRQCAVLLTVAQAEEAQTVRGMAESLNVSKPAITRAIDKLEYRGLARRRTDPTDRRSVLVTVTDEGRGLARRMGDAA